MDIEKEIAEAESKMKRELESFTEIREVNQAKILSPHVARIMINDLAASDSESVTYRSEFATYSVAFGFAEVKMPDGKLGLFKEIPDDDLLKKAETLGFLVNGLHPKKDVEADFHDDSVALMPEVELRRVYDFEMAVLRSVRK